MKYPLSELLLEKLDSADSIQLALAIVALLFSELSELSLKSKEMIRHRLADPIKSIEKNDVFKNEHLLLRTAKDLYKVVMTLGKLTPEADDPKWDPKEAENLKNEETEKLPKVLTEKMTVSDWYELLSDNSIPLRSGAIR